MVENLYIQQIDLDKIHVNLHHVINAYIGKFQTQESLSRFGISNFPNCRHWTEQLSGFSFRYRTVIVRHRDLQDITEIVDSSLLQLLELIGRELIWTA